MAAFFHYAAQIQLNVLAGRHGAALALAELADKVSWCARAYSEFAEYRFYTGLAHAAAYDESQPERREMHISGLREQHRKLTIWSARIPANFAARQTLLAAEIARIEGRELEAEQLYEESIRLARESSFVQIEAIAAECAARFYEARGIQTVVLSYLANARDCYQRWGADAKVRQIDEMYPHLRQKEPVLSPTSTIGAPVEHLDLATVLKVSEAVSGEIVLEKLIDTLLRTAIEHAGAERGLLILPQDSELWIQAQATTGGASITIDLRNSPISGAELPTVARPVRRAYAGKRHPRRCLGARRIYRRRVHSPRARPVGPVLCHSSSKASRSRCCISKTISLRVCLPQRGSRF